MLTYEHCSQNHSSWHMLDNFVHYFFTWYNGIMIPMGIIGSSICLHLIANHSLCTRSTRLWFLALTSSDIALLIVGATDLYFYVLFHQDHSALMSRWGPFGCEIRFSLIVSISWMANGLQTGLSLERMFSVVSPIRARLFFTSKTSKCIIATIIAVSLGGGTLITMLTMQRKPVLTDYETSNNSSLNIMHFSHQAETCERRVHPNSTLDITKLVYYVDLIGFRLIPFSLMLVSTVIIIYFIQKNKKIRRSILGGAHYSRQSCQQRSGSTTTTLMAVNNNNSKNVNQKHQQSVTIKQRSRKLSRRGSIPSEFRSSVILIIMNLSTLLTSPLFLIFELWDGAASEGETYAKVTGNHCFSQVLQHLFNSLIYFNHETNWIFYAVIGARFRYSILNMFRRFLCCCWSSGSNYQGDEMVSQSDQRV